MWNNLLLAEMTLTSMKALEIATSQEMASQNLQKIYNHDYSTPLSGVWTCSETINALQVNSQV